MTSGVPGTKILSLSRSLNEERWSFTRGSNYRALPGNVSVLLIHTGCWSLTRGGRRWRFGQYNFFVSLWYQSDNVWRRNRLLRCYIFGASSCSSLSTFSITHYVPGPEVMWFPFWINHKDGDHGLFMSILLTAISCYFDNPSWTNMISQFKQIELILLRSL